LRSCISIKTKNLKSHCLTQASCHRLLFREVFILSISDQFFRLAQPSTSHRSLACIPSSTPLREDVTPFSYPSLVFIWFNGLQKPVLIPLHETMLSRRLLSLRRPPFLDSIPQRSLALDLQAFEENTIHRLHSRVLRRGLLPL